MKKPLLTKFGIMAAMMLLLLIPISQIEGLIRERQNLRLDVIQDIADSSSHAQTITGPIWVQPYTKKEHVSKVNKVTGEKYLEDVTIKGFLYFLPESYRADAQLTSEIRKRGIYEAQMYHADTQLKGEFLIPKNYGIKTSIEDYQFAKPYITLGISDMRGIESKVTLSLDGQALSFEPGSKHKSLGQGIHAQIIPTNYTQKHALSFNITFSLLGTDNLQFTPIGRETYVHIQSDWPHPSFIGKYLPTERTINEHGFSARWRTSYFSTNFSEVFSDCLQHYNCGEFNHKNFGVSMINPVDHYVKSNRAIKYALLFIVLTFAGFFLFELLQRLKVHPVQYGLVGLALAVFYLLLMSLAEHMAFGLAYSISTFCCVGLIGMYVSYTLKSRSRAVGFSAGLAILYLLLYGLLSSEDYALLMGAILIFSVLGAFMMLTRNLDWYGVGKAESSTPSNL